jgi:uncharacterized phage protein gp47/JayE
MFEQHTYEAILERVIGRIDSTKFNTKDGSFLRTVLEPVCQQIAEAYEDMEGAIDQSFAPSAEYEYLAERAYDRGILPISGTPAKIRIGITPADLELEEGEEFAIGNVIYSVTALVGDGLYQCTCNENGTAGNIYSGTVVPVGEIEGLDTVTLVSVDEAGTDDETWDDLYSRYIDTYKAQPCGGNKRWYKEKIETFGDIFGCRIFPVGDGKRVKAYIIATTTNGKPMIPTVNATMEDVMAIAQSTEDALDPNSNGDGKGEIPSGHILTVTAAQLLPYNVAITLTMNENYSLESVQEAVKAAVIQFFEDSLLNVWKAESGIIDPNYYAGELITELTSIPGIDGATATMTPRVTTTVDERLFPGCRRTLSDGTLTDFITITAA